MIAVHAMYQRRSDTERFDFDVLVQRRLPLVRQVLAPYGLVRVSAHRGLGDVPDMSAPTYACILVLEFETLEGFQRGFREQRAQLDPGIAEYTDMTPVVTVTEVAGTG
jgi:uncharacterized protein (TIGR02118 family)